MAESLRSYFLIFYGIGILVLIATVLPRLRRPPGVEKGAEDLRRYIPVVFIPLNWLLPPALILTRVGEIRVEWPLLRLIGLLLGLYAAAMLLSAPSVLGRFLVPRAVVFQDHELVTRGPYRLVRHPLYSGILALWLGAALGTLNGLLVLLWPLPLFAITAQARLEEELLEGKFGIAYKGYAQRTGRFLPRFGKRGRT